MTEPLVTDRPYDGSIAASPADRLVIAGGIATADPDRLVLSGYGRLPDHRSGGTGPSNI